MFCLIHSQIDAQLEIIETQYAIHCYNNIENEALISFSKNPSNFIKLQEQVVKINGKLGSYTMHKSSIQEATNMQFTALKKSGDDILIHYAYTFKKKNYELILSVQEIYRNDYSGVDIKIISDLPEEINTISYTIPNTSMGLFGGGIQYSNWNLKGTKFPLIVEENGVGRGDKGSTFLANIFGAAGNHHTTYAPMPKFYSSNQKSYHLFSHSEDVIWEADFTNEQSITFHSNYLGTNWEINPSLQIFQETPLQFARLASDSIRSTFKLQEWMQGFILGVQGGKMKVDSLINRLKYHNIEVSAIWIQDWVGKRQTKIGSRLQWDWRPNYLSYPNLESWIDSLQQQDIKVLAYINPYFVEGGLQTITGIDTAVFIKDSEGYPYKFKAGGFKAYMIDLSSRKAIVWMKNIIKNNLLLTGFDGWMCDFGEWLPFDNVQLANTTKTPMYHNDFPGQWLAVNYEALTEFCEEKKLSSDDYFIFNRSWYAENNNPPRVMWLGDQLANFGEHDGLASAVTAYNTASISGIPVVHSDIGGYTAIKIGPIKFLRNDELLKRWIEFEAFTPIWRSHEGLLPEQMSQIYQDEEMLTFFAQFDRIHQKLISTHFQAAQEELIKYGYPLVRPLFMLYPNDKNTINIKDQIMVGDKLLVCPILKEKMDTRMIYLPQGVWKHFFTDEIFEGGKTYSIYAPLGQPAIFEKQ